MLTQPPPSVSDNYDGGNQQWMGGTKDHTQSTLIIVYNYKIQNIFAMSVFASSSQARKRKLGAKIERVKGLLEHLSLYVGLAIYTALGAKVKI